MHKIVKVLFFLLVTIDCIIGAMCKMCKMIVTVPVADLRKKPDAKSLSSQVLFNEGLVVEKGDQEKSGWLKAFAQEQRGFFNGRWEGWLGYVHEDCVRLVSNFPKYNLVVCTSWAHVYRELAIGFEVVQDFALGTRFKGKKIDSEWWLVDLPEKDNKKGYKVGYIHIKNVREIAKERMKPIDELRENIVKTAKLVVGMPYVLGGRSAYNKRMKQQITGIDCSGLVNLVYRVHGIQVPRNAHNQFLFCQTFGMCLQEGSELKPGDVLFFSPRLFVDENKGRCITHVALYLGNGQVCEARGLMLRGKNKGDAVVERKTRIVSVEKLIGTSIDTITSVQKCKGGDRSGRYVYLASFLRRSCVNS